MALYLVSAKSISYVDVLVEADSPDEAIEYAETLDGGEFDTTPYGDWEMDDAEEVTPEMLKEMCMEGRHIFKTNED